MKKLLFTFLLLSVAAVAQNGRIDSVALGPKGPIPNATVAVCTQPANASTQPCSPLANLCSSLTDAVCTQPNPLTADSLGNYHAYVKANQGPVTVQIYGPQVAAPLVLPDQSVNAPGFVSSLNNIKFADFFPSVQAAINALPAGGGKVYLTCGVSYGGPTSIPSGVTLESTCYSTSGTFAPYNTTLTYTNGQTFGPANGIAIKGILLSFTGNTSNLIFNGIQTSVFDMAVTCTTGSPCFNPIGTGVDTAFNRFDYLDITTAGAIGMQMSASGGGFVTDNEFRYLQINMTRATLGAITEAIGFTQNCDSNHFLTTHLFFTNVNAGNGIVFNDSGTPAVDVDASAENFDHVDFTSGISITGTGVQVNKSTSNRWVEGFGITGFTTPVGSDSTTHYLREQLFGAAIYFGAEGIKSVTGTLPVGSLTLPAITSAVVGSTLNLVGTYQSVPGTAGCTTAASIGGVCASAVTITWPAAFPSTAYSAGCNPSGAPTNLPSTPYVVSKAVGSMTVNYFAITAAAASWPNLDCWAILN